MTIPHSDDQKEFSNLLVGRRISSVEFVLNYVQLKFEGVTLTCVTLPSVTVAGRRWSWGETGFTDQLLGRIDQRVKAASYQLGDCVSLLFTDDGSIQISLKDEDYRAAEAVIVQSVSGAWWVL